MSWEKFESRQITPVTSIAAVAIQARGSFSVNKKGYELLLESAAKLKVKAKPLCVEFFFDVNRHAVGLRPSASSLNGYMLRKQPASESYLISARKFMTKYGIPFVTKRYPAALEGDTVVFFPDKPSKAPSGM